MTDFFHYAIRRPVGSPQVPIPFGARSVGHARLLPGTFEDKKPQTWGKIMFCYSGTAEVQFGGDMLRFTPGKIAVFMPGGLHWARALEGIWESRWWTIDGTLASETIQSFGYEKEGIYDGEFPPLEYFQRLKDALMDVTPEGEYKAGLLAYEMFTITARKQHNPDPDHLVSEAITLIEQMWNRHDFGIQQIARKLGIHRSLFCRRFKSRTGVSPSQYLIRLRIRKADLLLHETDMTVQEVAWNCGYQDAAYFTRLFKKIQGVTPSEARFSS